MGVGVAEAVVVEDFEQFGFLERGDGLARLVVVHEDDLEARRVERFALVGDAEVEAVLVHDPVVVVIAAQDLVERVADVGVGNVLGDLGVGGVFAGRGHHLAHGGVARARAENVGEIFEEAEAVDQAIGFAVFVDDGRESPRFTGECPGRAELRIRAECVEAAHDRLEARRGVGEQDGRFEAEGLQYPGGLRVERARPRRDGVRAVAFAQEPGVTHRGRDGIGIGIDVADDVDGVGHYLSSKNVRENLRMVFAIWIASLASSISGCSPE